MPLDSRGNEPVQPGGAPASSPLKVTRLKGLGAYARAHWKELLAIGLAAIPAAFLLFHKGTQQAAQQAISYPAALFGGGSADPGATSDASSGSSSSSSSGDGNCPAGYHWVPPFIPAKGMGIPARAGYCAPDVVGRVIPRGWMAPSALLKRWRAKQGYSQSAIDAPVRRTSYKGANPLVVNLPKKGKVGGS
jgi:hypothetical protein